MTSLPELSKQYPLWFCDVWGVIHNGREVFAAATDALARHRADGGVSLLLTNSPRSQAGVARQLTELGVPDGCYSAIVTSGDVTQELMRQHAGGKVFHLGPSRDMSIFEGQALERVEIDQAHAVLCTGLYHDDTETPADYVRLLADLKARKLAMICANPDKMYRRGDRLLYCAGSLAEAYAAIGGKVFMAGKPFTPIYELALKVASVVSGRAFTKADAMAIGDGPETDIRGAADFGIPAVLIADGVIDASLGPDEARRQVLAQVPSADIRLTLPALAWA